MKNIKSATLTLSFVCLSMGFAQTSNSMLIPSGAKSLVQLTNAKIVKVEDGCGPNRECFAPSTKVTIAFTLGCANGVTPVTYSTMDLVPTDAASDNKIQINYTAYEIVKANASEIRCMAIEEKFVTVTLFGAYTEDQVTLNPASVAKPL